ncbi:hypothetical protein TNCV_3635351 [Trichonephila clavipes]|nr:hypothetical protein TNCV_3635351 [Trichonephila clavipes]
METSTISYVSNQDDTSIVMVLKTDVLKVTKSIFLHSNCLTVSTSTFRKRYPYGASRGLLLCMARQLHTSWHCVPVRSRPVNHMVVDNVVVALVVVSPKSCIICNKER